MKSPNIIRARFIASILLLTVVIFGFGTVALAKPATLLVKPEASPKAAVSACTLSVTPLAHISPGSGETFQLHVTLFGLGCSWAAGSSVQWLDPHPASGGTIGTVFVDVGTNYGAPRTGYVKIKAWLNGQPAGIEYLVNVTQGTINCPDSFSFDDTSETYPSGNEPGFAQLSTPYNLCPRGAKSNASWLTIVGGNDMTGSGTLFFNLAANPGPVRIGKITLGNATLTVTQMSGCNYSFSPTSKNFDASGGGGSINVTSSDSACPRNATSNANWITIVGGNNSYGSGPVTYTVAANPGLARTGQIKLGGETFTVTQAGGCSYTLSPAIFNFQPGNGVSSFQVTASSSSCTWSPVSSASWVKITSAAQVTGNGTVAFTVDPNQGAARTATITIGNKTATINQFGANCTFTLSSSIFNFQASNGSGSIQVTASSDSCAWQPVSSALWLKINNGINPKMLGNGMFNFSVDPNPGAARTATITVGNKIATINQSANANCTFTISPTSWNFGASGGEVNVNVTASNSSCAWSTGNASPFISVVSGASGTGNGVAKIKVQPNVGAARTGSILIAGKTFAITQDGANGGSAMWITNISPGFASSGGKEFQMTVKGANFANGCKIRWNGEERQTTFVNGSTLVAAIPASDIADEGVVDVTVSKTNGADETNAEQFMVYGAVANVSSASFKGDVLAPASLVSAFGIDLAKELKIADSQPLPTELAGSTVTITDAAGKEHKAPLFFVSTGQINYLMPEGVALGKATVMVNSASGHTSVGTVEIAQIAPALFTANSNGQGVATAVALRVKANGQQVYEQVVQYNSVTGAFNAKPIDLTIPGEQVYLVLYGTGLRYRNSLGGVSLDMGGVLGSALYAGPTSGFVGLDQINVLVSNSLAGRGEVDVVLTVDGKKANTVKLMFK